MDRVNRGILEAQIVGYMLIEVANQESRIENPAEIEAAGVPGRAMEHLA